MRKQILKLREEGKSYSQICEILGCSKGTVSYHCGIGQKEKTLDRQRKDRKKHCLRKKVEKFKNPSAEYKNRRPNNVVSTSKKLLRTKADDFQRRDKNVYGKKNIDVPFTYHDIMNKFGDNPICYLTGRAIDWNQPRTYNLDHIIPASKNGDNSLSNLGLTCKEANKAKDDLTIDELLNLCEDILKHNGYEVKKIPG